MSPATRRHLFLTLAAVLMLPGVFSFGEVIRDRVFSQSSATKQDIAISGNSTLCAQIATNVQSLKSPVAQVPQATMWTNPFFSATPSINTTETTNEIKVTALLPAIELKNVSVRIQDNALILSTNEDEPEIIHQDGGTGEQSSLSSFQVSIPLPARVNAHQMKTIVQHGTLTVVIPKV
jgi:HSP20 family molecular chaperone IbpA